MKPRAKRKAPSRPAEGAAAERRKSERASRVEWILDAALDTAIEDGIGAVTTTRLASRLGYTVGALYRYFDSIDALLGALHRRTAELFYGEIFAALPDVRARLAELGAREDPRVRALSELVALPQLYRRAAADHPRHFELVGQLVVRSWPWVDASLQRDLDALVLPRVQEIVATTARAADVHALSPGDALLRTMTLWAGTHATIATGALAAAHPGLFAPDALFTSMTRSLLLGWGADAAELDTAFRLAAEAVGR